MHTLIAHIFGLCSIYKPSRPIVITDLALYKRTQPSATLVTADAQQPNEAHSSQKRVMNSSHAVDSLSIDGQAGARLDNHTLASLPPWSDLL